MKLPPLIRNIVAAKAARRLIERETRAGRDVTEKWLAASLTILFSNVGKHDATKIARAAIAAYERGRR